MKKIIPLLFILLTLSCRHQKKNDNFPLEGNISTKVGSFTPISFIPDLPSLLDESSGLIFFNGLLWSFNDSGGENKLYGFNTKGEIIKEIEIANSFNVDWEDIAQDDEFIYIGDFGNNNGIRKDLKIYVIDKKNIDNEIKQSIDAFEIQFSFTDQKKFDFLPQMTPYDCEAIIGFKGDLFVFTKDWSNETTAVYSIPAKKGNYAPSPLEKFNINGLVTGADISPNGLKLALSGYKDFKPFVWIFSGITKQSFFSGDKTFLDLSTIYGAQTEGICFKGNDSLLISCERTLQFNQQVFLIDLKQVKWNK